ncbi:Protein-associating with the carboxyl-terminal domain of ezrin [Bulinus truncatus]|nr:Protein-associating with the carboxyl-terminal domain of ezrin [Bulinus truncatus]
MGAENSILEGCQWDDPVEVPPNFLWQLSPITNTDGTDATVFEPKNAEGKDSHLLKKCALILKTLRHPNIIRFVGYNESSSHVWLATESVLPFTTTVHELSSEELCVGLYDILQGLDFLHSKLGMSHNNLCLFSVYVSPDGMWKLGGFEHACKFSDATQEYLEKCRAFRKESTLSPEEKSGTVSVDGSLSHTRDVFALGYLVESALDLVKEKDERLKLLEHQMKCCSSPDPAMRPKVSALLKMSAFSSDLIEILCFLKHITIKSEDERKEFFSNVLPRLQKLPENVIARRLVVPLLARFVLLNEWAEKLVLPHLLTPKGGTSGGKSYIQGLLSETLYKEFVINHLFNIFHVHDSHIRLILLEHFSSFVHLFSKEQLESDIFIQILLGIRDTNDKIVAASLRALADLVPLLGGDYIVGGRRKPFFFHGLPKKISSDDMLKLDIPKNMHSVLSHKPLLKDLALAKKMSTVDNSSDKEKKAIEKELRREEVRLKREERKKKLKEKLTVMKEDYSPDSHSESSLTIEQVADLDQHMEDTLKSRSEDSTNGIYETVAEHSREHNEEEDVEDEWSDWDDAEQRISDEIEAELESMTHTVTLKVKTSPSPHKNRPEPPSSPLVKIDWSDAPSADKVVDSWSTHKKLNGEKSFNGPLILDAKNKKINSSTNVKKNEEDFSEWGSENWEDSETKDAPNVRSPAEKNQSINKSPSAKPNSVNPNPKRNLEDLGMGLDIKSIEIKTKPPPKELDFFADMAPTITHNKSGVIETSSVSESSSIINDSLNSPKVKEELATRKSNTLFAATVISDQDIGDWGEGDNDWGNTDF